MHFSTISLALLASGAAAQTLAPSFTTPSVPASTDLATLVAQLPKCALQCFSNAAAEIGCAATDFKCLCKSASDLALKVGPCVALGTCSSDEVSNATSLAPQICAAVNNNPSPAEVSSASSLVTAALGTGSVTSTTGTNVAPARTDLAAMAVGAAGVAGAWAAYAL